MISEGKKFEFIKSDEELAFEEFVKKEMIASSNNPRRRNQIASYYAKTIACFPRKGIVISNTNEAADDEEN